MSKPPKILFLTLKIFSFTGGIERACRSLMKAIQEAGYALDTWSMYDPKDSLDERYGTLHGFEGFGGKRISFAWSVFNGAWKYDKVILSHINLLIFAKMIKILKPSTEIILWAHGIEVWRPISNWKKKFLQKHCKVWAVSNFTKQELMQRHYISEQHIKVLNNSLDPFFTAPSTFEKPDYLINRYGIAQDSFVLFTLTRLSSSEHRKNYDTVITSVLNLKEDFPNLIYIIGGKADAQEEARLMQIISQNGLEKKVKLIGFIDEQEITEHFLLADSFILPSSKEGFGIVFIEAATCGCQVIGGNIDGSTDALLNGELGQLINPNNEKEITNAIRKVLTLKGHRPEKQRELALEHFSFEKYQKKVKDLLN
jgi:phosphatidyl-myo-inositol dimannoside synthase